MTDAFTLPGDQCIRLPRWSRTIAVRRWVENRLREYARPKHPPKPAGMHVPDRLWRRQSALIMSLYDTSP